MSTQNLTRAIPGQDRKRSAPRAAGEQIPRRGSPAPYKGKIRNLSLESPAPRVAGWY